MNAKCAKRGLRATAFAALFIAAGMSAYAQYDTALDPIYPEGKRFPLALYSIHEPEEFADAADAGWNVGHRYGFSENYLPLAAENGFLSLAHLVGRTTEPRPEGLAALELGKTGEGTDATTGANTEETGETSHGFKPGERPRLEQEVRADIEAYASHDNLAWWDIPEEMRYWFQGEFDIVKNMFAWTRKYDPRKRPVMMYHPGHSTAERVEKYVDFLDIIAVGAYAEYSHQPRAWIRWRVESEIEAIENAGFTVGSDYLNGEKTPIGVPMLFGKPEDMDLIVPAEAYHDFFSCIASGAKGILVFSYWHKRDMPTLQKTWELGYKKAAADFMAEPSLNQAVLFGQDVPLAVEITKGSPRTVPFRPYGLDEDIDYPAVNVLAKAYEGSLYIIAVSSQERGVTAKVSGLPEGVQSLARIADGRSQEQGGNDVVVNAGTFEDDFGWLGVHIYTAQLQ